MRIVFLGTGDFGAPAFRAIATNHELALLIAQPDRPAGRHQRLRPPPLKRTALELGIPFAQPESVNGDEGLTVLREASPELIVVAAYGQILREPVFSLPPNGTVNIHASLLPRYRGPAPVNWAIINGETETGVTTFFIQKDVDTGHILMDSATPIDPEETAGELHDRLADLAAGLILGTIAGIASGDLVAAEQQGQATRAPKLSRDDGRVDWTRPAKAIHDLVRGTNPWPGAFTHLGQEQVKLHRSLRTGIGRGEVAPGEIALRGTGRLLVGTGDELLEIREIQRQSKSRVSGSAFLNGLRDVAGFR